MSSNAPLSILRSIPFASALVLAGTLCPSAYADAAVRVVSNCNNSGAGSLRAIVAAASSGDTIDLSSLSCSRILLTGGELLVPQNDLEFVGRSRSALTIDGNRTGRVINHTGTGTLKIRHVSIANGRYIDPSAFGGCIRSVGNVEMIRTRLHHCTAASLGSIEPSGGGGGIAASGTVLLSYSAAFANSSVGTGGYGGAVLASGELVLYRSQVYGNQADTGGGVSGRSVTAIYSLIHGNDGGSLGGGIHVHGSGNSLGFLELNKTTVSANRARSDCGIAAGGNEGGLIVDSSIVDNFGGSRSAGSLPPETRVYNSTIAYNREEALFQCAGAINTGRVLHLESTIVAGNTCTLSGGVDIWDSGGSPAGLITGSHNLIGRSVQPVPPDTIRSTDPRLAALAENGGPTRTRMPLADSPALERGSNPLDREFDQRGPGFARVRGAFPDIGAVER